MIMFEDINAEERMRLMQQEIEELQDQMAAMQEVLSRMMPLFTDNVRELADLRKEISIILSAAKRGRRRR